MNQKISHAGVIEAIAGDCVKVRIVQTSACAACKVAGHCNAAEAKVKIVDVFCCDTAKYTTGDAVTVWAEKNVANKALLLGFGLPLLLLLGVLLVVLYLTDNEGVAALAALGSLLPYYFLLWLHRDSIRQQVLFHLED